jgi:hypothetical protein
MQSPKPRRAFLCGIVGVAAMAAAFGTPATAWRDGQGIAPPPGPPPVPRPGLPAAPLTPGTAFILGRVVEAGSTAGVGDAIVTLSGAGLGPMGSTFTTGVPAGPRRVVTDASGRFLFRELPKSTYTINVTAPGYVDGSYGTTRLLQVARTLDAALARGIDVGDGERVSGVTVQMWKLGGIGGTVVDEAGEPIVGARVSVMARVTDWGGVIMQQTTAVTTDDRGMYHADVTPGQYVVAVLAAPTTLPSSSIEAYQQAQIGGTGRAVVLASIASGAPIPRTGGVRVGDHYVSSANSSSNILPPPQPGGAGVVMYPTTYYPASATAVGASIVTVNSGEEKPGINLQLRPVTTRRVAGRLISPNGQPAANTGIRLVVPDPAVARTSPATLIDNLQTVTDQAGEFLFLGVVPGPYTLRALSAPPPGTSPIAIEGVFRVPAPAPAAASAGRGGTLEWAADSNVVGDADVTDLTVRLKGGVTISGRVTFEGATPPPPASAFQPMRILPRPAPGTPGSLLTSNEFAGAVDQTGAFVTLPLVPGPYTLNMVGRLPPGWIVKAILAGGRDAMDVPVEIGEAGMSAVVVVLSDQISKLTGTVREIDGRPAATAAVVFFPVDRALWRQAGIASRRVQAAPTSRTGAYSFSGLPAGNYWVIATDGPGDFSDPTVLASLIPSATRVTMSEGASRTVDLRVVVLK